MNRSIEHLDFYPEESETISALQQMALLDQAETENLYQVKRKRRLITAMAGVATVMALSASGMGYLSNENANANYQSATSRIAETTEGVAMGLGMGAGIAAGGFWLLGRRRTLIPQTE